MQVKLSEFIDQVLKMWKAPLIHNLFDAHTAQLILDTSLQPLVTKDKMIWKGEKSGKYSVKSAYRICVTEIADSSHMHVHGRWNLIWKLKVPPKIKNFLWRVCRGCFPTRARLSNRRVSCPLDCVQCNNNYEDSIHILIECPKAVQILRDTNLWDTIDRVLHQDYNIHALIFTFLHNFSSGQCELMATIMWILWKSRNMKLWQQHNETNVQVFQCATHLLEEWRAAQDIRSRNSNQTTVPQVRSIRQEEDHWKKPTPDRYKCNIDASFSTSLNKAGLSMCLRDDDGAFVLARTEWFAPLYDIDVGEVVGLHTTIDWISNQQFHNVDFVLDCKRVVDCVDSSLDESNEFGCIITACKQLLKNRFQNSHVEFNRRQANRVAHELAQVAVILLRLK